MKMHIVLLPFPVQGHVNPYLSIARILARKGFSFTLVLTEEFAAKLQNTSEEGSSPIQYACVPSEGPLFAGRSGLLGFDAFLKVMHSMRPGFENLLRKLLAPPSQGVSCIIADCFVTWSQQVATQFNIPRFAFFTTTAHTFAAMLHADALISKGLTPLQDPEQLIDCIPGLPPLRAGDLPHSVRMQPSFPVDVTKDISESAGVIFNTVYKFERKPLEVIRKKVPIYPIGPMLLIPGSEESFAGETLSLWTEERDCLKWLDSRLACSVLFVAFGSMSSVGGDQIRELAEGLEASGQAFLWVLRSKAVDGPLPNVLPEAFMERTKGRGLIITWAPQVQVLSHPAVGGFLTHCGWNSITENFSKGGVPMICLPQMAEQRLNARLLVDEWRVGLELQEENGVVKREVVENAVRELMQGEVGRELRKRAIELKETASLAVQEGGTSHSYLGALAEDIERLELNHSTKQCMGDMLAFGHFNGGQGKIAL